MSMFLTCSAFDNGGSIPRKYTKDGQDHSPPLRWRGVPSDCVSLALICDDPDAPAGTWAHWVIYNIPGGATALPEGIPADLELPDGSLQGMNDYAEVGYGGPCPPPGKAHDYHFRLYALDAALALGAGASRRELLRAMNGHVIGQAHFRGHYLKARERSMK